MAEELWYTEFTYTYDQFTVFFYGDRVFIGKKDSPIGQRCVDILNLDDAVLDEIDRRVKAFIPAAQNLLAEKTDSAAYAEAYSSPDTTPATATTSRLARHYAPAGRWGAIARRPRVRRTVRQSRRNMAVPITG